MTNRFTLIFQVLSNFKYKIRKGPSFLRMSPEGRMSVSARGFGFGLCGLAGYLGVGPRVVFRTSTPID